MTVDRTLLLVEDEPDVRAGLQALLEHGGWNVIAAESVAEARHAFDENRPDVALVDVMLPDGSGIDILEYIKASSEGTPVIMASGVGTIDMAVRAMRRGAESFLPKPYDIDNLELLLEQAMRQIATSRQLVALRRGAERGAASEFIGDSPEAQSLRSVIERVAPAPSPILLLGESGTGKGLVARILHTRSPRARQPFVDLNCAGLGRELLESELFGHERGAFTDARAAKPGLLEIATGGTVFLDEIGELDPAVQARLLKALEDKKFRRVGGLRDIHVDIRLIAATNRDLDEEVSAGRFRKDLYYRLNVVKLAIPPLRNRPGDVPAIASGLLVRLATELGRPELSISERALERLQTYEWPGNVRELRNVLERAALLSADGRILVEDLPLEPSAPAAASLAADSSNRVRPLEDVIVEAIQNAVAVADGNIRKAARLLGVSPTTIYSRLKRTDGEEKKTGSPV